MKSDKLTASEVSQHTVQVLQRSHCQLLLAFCSISSGL